MILESPVNGKKPDISKNAFIFPHATIIGNVIIKDNVNIWSNVILRAELGKIEIGKNSSIQDYVLIESSSNKPVSIGKNVLIEKRSIIKGFCLIPDNFYINMNSNLTNVGDVQPQRSNSGKENEIKTKLEKYLNLAAYYKKKQIIHPDLDYF